ncbi:hypothetical protein HIM_01562 [Hirsutella minnesotensis 3608]|nr:hypothetical protein HIM_01562 [Hirsutella minnesotensis 3608]
MAQKQVGMNDKTSWDDSALIDSWNEALQEYKKYHSIHARGGSIQDLMQEDPVNSTETSLAHEPATSRQEEPEASIKPEESAREEDDPIHVGNASSADQNDMAENSATGQNGVPHAPVSAAHYGPAALAPPMNLGLIQDENLKRLLMSWYYAGYYMGLYQGSQQTN